MNRHYVCDGAVFRVPSFSDEDRVYTVVIPVDPAVSPTCTCPAFFYRGFDGECKHIREMRFVSPERPSVAGLTVKMGDMPQDEVDLVVEAFGLGYRFGKDNA